MQKHKVRGEGFVGDLIKIGRKNLVNLAREPLKKLATSSVDTLLNKVAGEGRRKGLYNSKLIGTVSPKPRVISYGQKPLKPDVIRTERIKGGMGSISRTSGGKAFIRKL